MRDPSAILFDRYASDYAGYFGPWPSLAGASVADFARTRIEWLGRRLRRLGERPGVVMDFGCGTGAAAPVLLDALGADRVIGIDPSLRSLDVAPLAHGRTAP